MCIVQQSILIMFYTMNFKNLNIAPFFSYIQRSEYLVWQTLRVSQTLTLFWPMREQITFDQWEEEIILQSFDPVWDLLFTWGHSRSPYQLHPTPFIILHLPTSGCLILSQLSSLHHQVAWCLDTSGWFVAPAIHVAVCPNRIFQMTWRLTFWCIYHHFIYWAHRALYYS